ncbi:MAG: metalloregulator ArsR/SmtB family transcription factor [Candidatus Gastranaerophilales bacterium]|nr:metalloregulator ArsR/SmtB family transcription factor [Candidatus Gastranaerophilales bacterium]
MQVNDYVKIFDALSHPIRLKIVCGLVHAERCNVGTMSQRLGVSQSLISQHVNILKNAEIIKGYREGNVIWYKLENDLARKLLTNIEINICDEN